MHEEPIQIAPEFRRSDVPMIFARDGQAIIKNRFVRSSNEAVAPQAPHLGSAILDALQGRQQLVGMRSDLPQNSRPLLARIAPTGMPSASKNGCNRSKTRCQPVTGIFKVQNLAIARDLASQC